MRIDNSVTIYPGRYHEPPFRKRVKPGPTLALVLFAGCVDEAPGTGNSSQPIVVESSAVHVLGTSESIAEVLDLEVLPDSSVWVLNSVEPLFVHFGPDGSVLDAIGANGGGPGEFGAPVGFVSGGREDRAWVFDVRRHAVIEASTSRARSEIAIPIDSMPPGRLTGGMNFTDSRVRTVRLGDEIVFARNTMEIDFSNMFAFWASVWAADFVGLSPAGTARGIARLREVLGDPPASLDQTGDFPPFPLWFRLWDVCPDGHLWVHDRPQNQLRSFATDGTELDATPLPQVPFTTVTDDEFARAVLGFVIAERTGEVGGQMSEADTARVVRELIDNILVGTPEELANFLPRYVDFRCDGDGNIWLRPLDLDLTELRGGRDWIRISPAGPAREVHFPERFDPYRFTRDRIWGVQRDQFDIAYVAWIDVTAVHRKNG